MAVLTKYTKTLDTQSSQYTSQKEYIDSLATEEVLPLPDDFRTPFTYQEWLQRNAGIIPGKEYDQYNQYLKDWHQNTYTVSDTTNQVKEEYYQLLSELSVAFSTPEEVAWFEQLDITNDLDLEEAIPFFTKKLKEIGIYFVNKRDAIKKAKLKYNMVGSRNALERLFYEYLLKAFTQRDYVLNVPEQSAYDTFPELSAVRDGFQIFIEELYDDTSYFDKDISVPISSYYDLNDSDVLAYFNSVSFDLSAIPWLYQTGMSNVHSNNPLTWTLSSELETYGVSSIDLLPTSAFSEFDNVLLNKYINILGTRKYLGAQKYILSGGYYELDTRNVEHDFVSGNNWFYWPSGEYFREDPENIIFDSIPIEQTSLVIDGATPALSYDGADKLFTQRGSVISGAWLRYTDKYLQEKLMQGTLFVDKSTKFKFPFPGYGLSGEGAAWTGPQLTNALNIESYSDDVLNLYWATTPTSAIQVISIHDTTLVDDGAFASKEYSTGDEISVRITSNDDRIHDLTSDETYKGGFDRAWLYRMEKTDIPLKVGQTNIAWPLHTYDSNDVELPVNILSSQCVPVRLSEVNVEDTLVGARAGHGLFDSDLIYKLNAPDGYPIECAWLSGTDLKTLATTNTTLMYNATGKIQPSFTLKCRPGTHERFVWYDVETFIKDSTIVHHEHQIDCPYILNTHKSIYDTKNKSLAELGTNGIGNWNDCVCRAIKYSPLGHPGDDYSDYSYMADIVFVDTQFPEEFDLESWRGTDGLAYNQSKDFAFFQLSANDVEPDVGWGTGNWKTGDGSEFKFNPGVVYKYLRANLLRSPGDLIVDSVPDLIIKQKHTSTPATKWMKADLQSDGTWDKTNELSPMVLNAGDYVMYDHIDSNWFCLSSDGDNGYSYSKEYSATKVNDTKWATYDFVSVGTDVSYAWPSKFYVGGPDRLLTDLSAVSWEMIPPSGSRRSLNKVDPINPFVFTAEFSGTYSVQATGYGNFGVEAVTISPDLTCSEELLIQGVSGQLGIETTYNDRINMLINIPLSGWDYATNSYNGRSLGARPFWGKVYDNKSKQTKQKGTYKWGGGVRTVIDDYTFVTQPDVSTITLSANDFVDYTRRGTVSILWQQPVNFVVNEGSSQWCNLVIDPSKLSPLNDYLYNITNEMVVSATNNPSKITLDNSSELFVNYWSNSDFTWTQRLVNSTNGLPPTGGKWVAPVSGSLVEPLVPYANLSNRHFPTIATMPYIGGLYSTEDSGGYFVPRMLGATTYVGKGWTNGFDTTLLSNTPSARGDSAIFTDPEIYVGNDRGLSHKNQLSPVVNKDNDQRWQKGLISEGIKAGEVVGVKEYQEYIPYQTKYESTGYNFKGLLSQNDEYDPWTGDKDNMWADPTYFPPNFRNEYDILDWYENKLPDDMFIYQWKTDIFGNNYALLKDISIEGVYEKRQAFGEMWMKNQENVISPISGLFPTYDLYQDSVSSVSYVIKDFDIWYDTIMFKTSSHAIIEHINFDWDANRIYTFADEINTIDLETSSGGKYGGHWLFDEEKQVTLCHVLSDGVRNTVYPVLFNYDIDRILKSPLLNLSGDSGLNALSALQLESIEEPVFSYNEKTNNYNLSFIGHSSLYTGPIVNTMIINKTSGLESLYSITPSIST